MRKQILAVASLLLIASQTGASAQEAASTKREFTPDQLFNAYLNSESYKSLLNIIFNSIEPAVSKAQCPELKIEQANVFYPLRPVTFTGPQMEKVVESGAWIALATFDRCGKPAKRRAILEWNQSKVRPIGLLPGDFKGDLLFERDARKIVFPLIQGLSACKDQNRLFVLDTIRSPESTATLWKEEWISDACGKAISVDVTYVKHGDETNISAQRHNSDATGQ